MKYASERGGMATSVHDWKPCPPDQFAKLLHLYTITCGCQHGHEGLFPTAMKLDRVTTATIWYMPKSGQKETSHGVSSPVLMTVQMSDGKVICFESLKYGLETYGLGATPTVKVPDDGIERINAGLSFRTSPKQA